MAGLSWLVQFGANVSVAKDYIKRSLHESNGEGAIMRALLVNGLFCFVVGLTLERWGFDYIAHGTLDVLNGGDSSRFDISPKVWAMAKYATFAMLPSSLLYFGQLAHGMF